MVNGEIRHHIHSYRRLVKKNPTPYRSAKLLAMESELQVLMCAFKSAFESILVTHFSSNKKTNYMVT